MAYPIDPGSDWERPLDIRSHIETFRVGTFSPARVSGEWGGNVPT
jgi:hypothetical protein